MLITSSWAIDFVIFFITISYLVIKFYARNNDFFKKRGVKYVKPKPIVGNVGRVMLLQENTGNILKEIYDSTDAPYYGMFFFHVPYLVLKSPQLIKEVLVKEFGHFMNRTWAQAKHDEIQKNMMFFQHGEEWKLTRAKVSPVFTSGKLKGMFYILKDNGELLVDFLRKNADNVDLEKMTMRYVLNGISRCFFGINPHCLEDGVKSEFLDIIQEGSRPSTLDALRMFCFLYHHKMVDFFKLNMFNKKMVDYCANTFNDVLKTREEARRSNNMRVNDMADIIIDLKYDEEFNKNFDFGGDKVLAQPFMFLLAGNGTTTMSLTFTLYELCINPDVQSKLRDAINEMIDDYGGITYEGLMDKKYSYIDMVLAETHRMYPAIFYLDRTCTSDFQLPGTDYVVRKGEKIIIPTWALHYDEKYFPDPYKFNPERFLKRVNEDGFYYVPFGEGPRECIGNRFALLNLKVALSSIIPNFSVEKTPQTPARMKLDPVGLSAIPKGRLIVDFKPLT
ncbi:unnamed protein product [Acanthoscelides obtectus]|nr:unnamed protein product [Acanthoscelides obtectus]CAK1666103.1 Cytochrome P450 6j1 [Acanthoscelides obtectus]